MRIGRVAGTAATVTFHSVHSAGGELEAGESALAARAAGLDFVMATDHNTAEGHEAWSLVNDPDLVVLFGQEVVTRTGHWLALGLRPGQVVDWDYGVGDGAVDRVLAECATRAGCAWRLIRMRRTRPARSRASRIAPNCRRPCRLPGRIPVRVK